MENFPPGFHSFDKRFGADPYEVSDDEFEFIDDETTEEDN